MKKAAFVFAIAISLHAPSNAAPLTTKSKSAPLPAASKHYYALAQPDGLYGYEQALSAYDQQAGVGSRPLVMVRYLGHAVETGEPVFDMPQPDGFTRIWCLKHCTYVKSITYTTWARSQPQYMPVAAGTILWEITRDAANGQMQRLPHLNLSIPVDIVEDERAPSPVASAPQLPLSSQRTEPSFDCSKATHIDSITICEHQQLSALDRQWSAAYRLQKATAAPSALKSWRDNFLQQRRACGSDAQCIAAAYTRVLNSTP